MAGTFILYIFPVNKGGPPFSSYWRWVGLEVGVVGDPSELNITEFSIIDKYIQKCTSYNHH